MVENMFEGMTPTRYLWVSANAAPGGDGSEGRPFQTIQAAVNIAGAGDAVMVRAGEYKENVKIKQVGGGGSETAPLWIVSADGAQAAHIVAVNSTAAAFTGSGAENVVLSGFHITGGKNGIQFSQNGSDFTDMPKNIVIQGNLVDGSTEDAIKVDHAENVSVVGNTLKANAGEGVDFVAVNNSMISHNEVSGAQGSAGIMVKGGSTNVLIDSNWVHDIRADGISVGGWTDAKFFMPGHDTYEATGIEVVNNVVENVGKRAVNVLGATHSSIHDNYLEATLGYYAVIGISSGNPDAAVIMHSADIDIINNTFTRSTQLISATAGDKTDLTIAGNKTGAWDPMSGDAISGHDSVDLVSAVLAQPAASTFSAMAFAAPVLPARVLFELHESDAYTHKFVGSNTARDTLNGTSGNDYLDGKKNQDTMTGGAGDDTYVVDVSADKVIEKLNGGIDTVITAKTGAYQLAANVENLVLNGKVAQHGVGNGLDNLMRSNDYGSHLEGGAGNDILVAGRGGGQLQGDSGDDIFRFDAVPTKAAHILDFQAEHDMIDLRPLFATAGYTGADPVKDHVLTLSSDGAGGTAVYFDADGAGGHAASLVAVVDHVDPTSLHVNHDWFFH